MPENKRERTVFWDSGTLKMIDQRLLPAEYKILELPDVASVVHAIRDMAVRGAPAIGATAAYGLAIAAKNSQAKSVDQFLAELDQSASQLATARPTASNLFWALERICDSTRKASETDEFVSKNDTDVSSKIQAMKHFVLQKAETLADEDVAINRQMGANGAALLPEQCKVIHHCNTGSLATVDYGTALGVIRAAHEHGKDIHVLVDETRPRLQGARLSAWELKRLGIGQTLIADGAAGQFMRRGGIDAVLVGADRVAANGDVANKIGTYSLAVLAKENGVPFYVVAPTSTVDLKTANGDAIPIEERPAEEVTTVCGQRITPEGVNAANPAFDITPNRYVTAIVTEEGVIRAPYEPNLKRAVLEGIQKAKMAR